MAATAGGAGLGRCGVLAAPVEARASSVLGPARPPGDFPQISGPRILLSADERSLLAPMPSGLQLLRGGRRTDLGDIERARMAIDARGAIHVAALKGGSLVRIRIDPEGKVLEDSVAPVPAPHGAAGLDIACAPGGALIAGPGPAPGRLALYRESAGWKPLLLMRPGWLHPVLAWDPDRSRLHLAASVWNDWSSMYDGVFHMMSGDEGATWRDVRGAELRLHLSPVPIEHGHEDDPRAPRVSASGQAAAGESNALAHAIHIGPDGNPTILYSFARPYGISVGPSTDGPVEPWMRTKLALPDGKGWTAGEICPRFTHDVAGGTVFAAAGALHSLLMFREAGAEWLDLGLSTSTDGGRTWGPIAAVSTEGSKGKAHLVSPQAVLRGKVVSWVCGTLPAEGDAVLLEGSFEL